MASSVVAVDPAELSPAVAELPNVHHLKLKSQDEAVAQQLPVGWCTMCDIIHCTCVPHGPEVHSSCW